MDSEFLLNLKEISIESIIIAGIVFALTMLIKWPIKKATSTLQENKRKAVNTVIVFIPIVLSFALSVLYYGIFLKQWFSTEMLDTMTSSYFLALLVYAIFSRIVVLIKGVGGKTADENFSKETISYIKQNIKTISKTLKTDETKLANIVSQIENLVSIRNEICNNSLIQDIAGTEKLDNDLLCLSAQQTQLTADIEKNQLELQNLKQSLKQ